MYIPTSMLVGTLVLFSFTLLSLVLSGPARYKDSRYFFYFLRGAIALFGILYLSITLLLPNKPHTSVSDTTRQIARLDSLQIALSDLQGFLDNQKSHVLDVEKEVNRLREENQKLEPVVEAKRQEVEAVFSLLEDRSRRHIWRDRIVSFLIGVASSLFAALIYKRRYRY